MFSSPSSRTVSSSIDVLDLSKSRSLNKSKSSSKYFHMEASSRSSPPGVKYFCLYTNLLSQGFSLAEISLKVFEPSLGHSAVGTGLLNGVGGGILGIGVFGLLGGKILFVRNMQRYLECYLKFRQLSFIVQWLNRPKSVEKSRGSPICGYINYAALYAISLNFGGTQKLQNDMK